MSDLRIGDRERERVSERLAKHAAAGRLSYEELESRLDRAQAAVFERDLLALEADLPGPVRRSAPRRAPLPVLAIACLVAAVWLSVVVGHPIPPLFILAGLLWMRARRVFPAS
jgi:hypothetical protein